MPHPAFHFQDNAPDRRRSTSVVTALAVKAAYLEDRHTALDISREWLARGESSRFGGLEGVTDTAGPGLELPLPGTLRRQVRRTLTSLSREIGMAVEHGERMMHLTAAVAQQVQAVRANLQRTGELMADLNGNRARRE
ncbi:hypothetical protein [Microvirga calopogonii]|uniref:hypothetical protein n=1 Tax=Microvirga calopogonii TaxID=2078013 RepID=UPI000E0D37AE|nr:hypothetical protein [Microvirga calopogonii]